MPVRDTTRLGEPVWIDLMSSDPARSQEFYTQLFGWTTTESEGEGGSYVTFWKGDAQVAGLGGQMPGSTAPDAWSTYLAVADADATTEAARAAGAQVLLEPMTVGEHGRMAILADPSGAAVSIWQPFTHTGFGVVGEVGAPVWHELNSRDFDAALPFYEQVFGWSTEPLAEMEDVRYITFGPSGAPVGGVFDAKSALPEGVPSHWQVYLGVPDVAAAADRVKELGGTVLREPWVTEYGTFSQVADPTGAAFLLSSVDQM